MSNIKMICPHCGASEFTAKLACDIVLSFDVTDEDGITQNVIDQSNEKVTSMKCACGGKVTVNTLVQGACSDVSGKWYPVDQVMQAEMLNEKGEQVIVHLTQEEYNQLTAPTVDQMDESQLREYAKTQDDKIGQLEQQIQQMMQQLNQVMNSQPAQAIQSTEQQPAMEQPVLEQPVEYDMASVIDSLPPSEEGADDKFEFVDENDSFNNDAGDTIEEVGIPSEEYPFEEFPFEAPI